MYANGVRLQAKLESKNHTGLPVGVVRTVLPDVAEGVYAASSNPDPKISDLIVVNNWGEGGEVKCIVNFSEFDNLSNLTLFLEFNAEVSDVSSNGAHTPYPCR